MVQNIQRYISQLGMMVIAVGLSSYNVALFHLVNHAFYKGLLFLGAGAVIHAVADNQDFRKYGGLISFLPLTYSVMLIASLSLVAFPFMTGFYSKDFILESAYGQFNLSSVAVYFIATIGAMFTTLYSVKVLYLTFLTNANGPLINYKRAHEGDVFMSLPLIILAVFSIFFGYITKDMFIGMASGFFSDNSLFTHPLHEIMLETEFAVPTLFKLLPFFLTVILSALSLILSEFLCKSLTYFKLTRMGYNIFSFFNQRLLIELFYNKYITCFILNLGGQTTKVLDKGSIELLGPYGLEKGLLRLSKSLSSLDTGVITSYALFILIGLILYILIPYISLIEISILLCIISGLLSIAVNMFSLGISSNIQQSHLSVSLFIQNALFKCGSFFVSDKNIISFAGQSRSRLPLNCVKLFSTVPSYNHYKFKFDYLPCYHYDLIITGKEAANFETIKNKLDWVLDYSNKDKIRFVFGIINIIPVHNLEPSLFKYVCLLKNLFAKRYQKVSYYKEGIEVIYSPQGICAIINMIKHVISDKAKNPELIHIIISFWPTGLEIDYDMLHNQKVQDNTSTCGASSTKNSQGKSRCYSTDCSWRGRRLYSTECSWGGHGDNNSIDMCFQGVNAVDSNFVFEELAGVLSSEHKYHCQINIRSSINKIRLCKELDTTCIQIGYNIEDIIRVVNDILIPTLRSYNYKPKQVDVVLSFFELDECEQLSFKYENNSKFRPGYNGTATDIYMPGVDAVDHKILWDEVSFSTYYDYLGIQNGFVGVLDEANARNEFINPIHFKYITFSINEESMPDLAELIASTIKEARTTPEEMWVVLSYWKSDGSGGGTNFKSTSLVPKVSQPINRNKSLRSRTRRKSNVIKKRMYSTINYQQPNQLGIKNKSNWFTYPLFISIIIGVGLYLAYRFPMYFMLGQLDLLIYYPLFNLMITLCSIIIMASLKGKETKPIQLYLAIFFTFFAMLLFWFGSGYYRELYASFFVFFTNLPFIWESLKDNTMPYGGSTTCYKTTPSGLSSGGGSSAGIGSTGSGSSAGAGAGAGVSSTGSSASGTGGGSGTGDASSTNILNAKALIERSSQLDKDLADDAFVLKGNIQQEAVKEIAKKFPRIDSRDVPSSVLPYLSFYNLKCRALQEHMVIEACGVKLENSTTKPELALAWRQAKLASISEECSDTMNKYYNTLPRSPRRFIDRTFKNKPW